MRQEDVVTNKKMINERISQILDCGFRYAKYKLCLKRNRQKVNSRFLPYYELLNRLKEEVAELEKVLSDNGLLSTVDLTPDLSDKAREMIAHEAADVINFACFICDRTEEL